MTGLGLPYDNGQGVAQDYAAARSWYEKGAAGGDAVAMNNLGVLYANGWGVRKDAAAARLWYAKAAGSAIAVKNLAGELTMQRPSRRGGRSR